MDPAGRLRQIRDKFQKARQAYLAKSPAAFNEAAAAFLAAVRELGPQLGEYPVPDKIAMEVAYNHWAPFRFAWVLMLAACLGVLASTATGRRLFYHGAMASFLASVAAMLVGFGLRVVISGRAPVTNMYESVIYVALGAAVLGLVLAIVYPGRILLAAAAAVSALALVLADNCPVAMDPSLQPLTAILRSNYWLIIHVMTVTASYAAFALAWIIGNVALGYYLFRSKDRATLDTLLRVIYWTLLIGVLLLEVGTVLGAMWADKSWGRFWSWDRKEVWALISLLIYLAVLHGRAAGWVGGRGLAALSAVGFALVLMAWYGVNLMGGGSLHTYGLTGGSGQASLAALLLAAQFLYVLAAMSRIPPGEAAG
jgi:ABC-type transport system involved in cytochrome c biogenesis permease subunit